MRFQACFGFAVVMVTSACASSPERRAIQARERWCKDTEAQSLDVFMDNSTPQRPYRQLGSVDARFDLSDEGRFRTLRVHACEMGADAIMHAGIQVIPLVTSRTVTWTDENGNTRQRTIEEPAGQQTLGTAIAIAYNDHSDHLASIAGRSAPTPGPSTGPLPRTQARPQARPEPCTAPTGELKQLQCSVEGQRCDALEAPGQDNICVRGRWLSSAEQHPPCCKKP